MKITKELLVAAANEISQEELDEFANQPELVKFARIKTIEAMVVSISPEFDKMGMIKVLAEQLIIAMYVGVKLGRKEATTELTQVS